MAARYYSNILPDTLENSDKKRHLYTYRYNFTEETIEENETQYSWNEVYVYAPLTSSKIIQAVLTNEYNVNYEQKLINEYNSALLGLYSSDEEIELVKTRYEEYLSYRKELKENIETDLQNLKIS